ncbi:hypothetical protein GCM10009734_52900 [Nonomuraea bangladeshensis]
MRNPAMVTPATPLGRNGHATPHAAAPCTKVRTLRCQVPMPAEEAGNIRPPLLTGRDYLEELRRAERVCPATLRAWWCARPRERTFEEMST